MAKILNMGKATIVIPELEMLLDSISMKKPLYEYKAIMARETFSGLAVNKVQILLDAEVIGSVSYMHGGGRADSDGNYPDAFYVQTTHIRKERGVRDTIITSDAKVALKNVIKHFAAPNLSSVCHLAVRSTIDMLENVTYQSRNDLSDVVSYNGTELICYFIEREKYGTDAQLPPSLVVNKDKMHLYDNYLAGKQITKTMKAKEGYVVWMLPDTSIRTLPLKYTTNKDYEYNVAQGIQLERYRNFTDMPTSMQEKISVLKIAQLKDMIMDIGVKLNADPLTMYILE